MSKDLHARRRTHTQFGWCQLDEVIETRNIDVGYSLDALAALVNELSRQIRQLKSDFNANQETMSVKSSQVVQLNERGIDFYREVERFEIGLIRSALKEAGGSQTQAAKLLRINPTTLNAKMKHYGINSFPWMFEVKTVDAVEGSPGTRLAAKRAYVKKR